MTCEWSRFMKTKKNYLIITIYGLIVLFALTGLSNVFGSSIDWSTQHTVIPDYFRKLFYGTGKLIPNLAFNLGAGQNIFNFSYYGLINPYILISYLLPFIKMETYISCLGIALHIATGLLLYKFLTTNNFSEKTSLFLSLALLSIAPLTYHFHYQIMFVWYLPFLLLSLIGVDKYLNENKSFLLIISIFLLILTNYYFAVTSLITIAIYGIYKILKNVSSKKDFFSKLLKAMIRVGVAIMLAAFLLIPTAKVILGGTRVEIAAPTITELLTFNIKNSLYHSYNAGITIIFLVALTSAFCLKKKDKATIFLNSTVFILTMLPFVSYALNGFLYIRGKALIPLIPLYIYVLATFLKNIKDKNIDYKKLLIVNSILIIYIITFNYHNKNLYIFIADLLLTISTLYLYQKKKNTSIVLIPLIFLLLVTSFVSNENARYITKEAYQKMEHNNEEIISLINKIEDNSFYRVDANTNTELNMNRVWNLNTHLTSIYSSGYNSYYHKFYNEEFLNNITYRNNLMTSNTTNPLFYDYMGVKYIISPVELNYGYTLLESTENYYLYQNDNAYPIIYTADKLISVETYQQLSPTQKVEALLNNTIIKNASSNVQETLAEKLELPIQETTLDINDKEDYHYTLKTPITDKYLIITFKLKNDNSCRNGDTNIIINGVKNKLTCKEWYYYNNNKNFEYVLYSAEGIKDLDITITKGHYEITDIKAYTLPKTTRNFSDNVTDLTINQKTSTITANVISPTETYLVTTLPYDEGYTVYIDDKEVSKELVNTAFLGFKVPLGNHKIEIVYNSPGYKIGLIISFLAVLSSLIILKSESNYLTKKINIIYFKIRRRR